MTECRAKQLQFQGLGKSKVEGDFSGGYLSSDGGGLLLREFESKRGLIKGLSRCFYDWREKRWVEHRLEELLRQRLFGLALGYEDLNDHSGLRRDPLLAVLSEKEDPLGMNRRDRADRGKALASASTLNRLELGSEQAGSRYHKIAMRPEAVQGYLLKAGVKAIRRKSREVVLDFDATDDPLHGQQEGRFFHGYYGHYCYLPLYCFCGSIPLWAQLRSSDRDASDGTVEALEKIVAALRRRFGRQLRIIVRGDSGFAREPIMAFCEEHKNVYYCLGLAKNTRLKALLEPAMRTVREQFEPEESSVGKRRYEQFEYRTLKSWSRTRRVIGKAEVLGKGDNPRFIVTNLPAAGFAGAGPSDRFAPGPCYERLYCARGDMENRIKEQQLDMFADRTSTHCLRSNQLRLWLSTFAYMIVDRLRAEALQGTVLARATVGTIRLRLFKVAASIHLSVRRVHVRMASAYPYQEIFALALWRLRRDPG
jgi:hypothetical protein